jgi:hypothetical protein
MADVEVVATYELYNVNRVKLENLIHRVFDPVQMDIEIRDRFGNAVKPREWFLIPVFVMNEVVERIKDGTITQYVYDPTTAGLVKAASLTLAEEPRLLVSLSVRFLTFDVVTSNTASRRFGLCA